MKTKILDGKKIANNIKKQINEEVAAMPIKPKLVVIKASDDKASDTYIKHKKRACIKAGIDFELIKYNDDVKTEKIIKKIKQLNKKNNAILVQLPLFDHLGAKEIINTIDPSKDVDGLTIINQGKLVNNENGLIPCTALGIITLLKAYKIKIKSKHVVIIGRSKLVGKPLIDLFLKENATVTSVNSYTKNVKEITKQADILVVAVGKKYLIDKKMIKKNVVILDVGINNKKGKLYGDVNPNVLGVAEYVSPVPGGIGPMTVATLLNNIVRSRGMKDE